MSDGVICRATDGSVKQDEMDKLCQAEKIEGINKLAGSIVREIQRQISP
jgi:hypothetical protein